jgi:hypothetical protein
MVGQRGLFPAARFGLGFGLWELERRSDDDGALVLDLLRAPGDMHPGTAADGLGDGAMLALALRRGHPKPAEIVALLEVATYTNRTTFLAAFAFASAGWLDVEGVRTTLQRFVLEKRASVHLLAASSLQGEYYSRWSPL